MSKDSITDYVSCILYRATSFSMRRLPPGLVLFLGRRLGDLFYYLDARHRAVAYANIKTAFAGKASPSGLAKVAKEFYRAFGQTLMETFILPRVDKKYLDKYVTIEGLENIAEGFKRNKGVILAVVHEGSWEMSNIVSSNLGYPFNTLIRDQPRFKRLNALLNHYRAQKGAKLIQTESQTKRLIEALKKNEAVAMTVDQGGNEGVMVEFFGKDAPMSTGAIKLALKFDAAIIPVFSIRTRGPYIRFKVDPPFEVKKTGDSQKDVAENLQRLIGIYEKYISLYPKEYLWTYKIWKLSPQRNILILSDGKAGHLRQSQAAAKIARDNYKERHEKASISTIEVRFKNKFSRVALALGSCFSGKYNCQGCLWCFRRFLAKDTYDALVEAKPDMIISCGSKLASVNLIASRENLAKSVVVMRPAFLSTNRFNLVIMERHDSPSKKKNVVITEGALNLVDDAYLDSNASSLRSRVQLNKKFVLGLLLGGDSKDFKLSVDSLRELTAQLKDALETLDGEILISTSRRTPPEVEQLLKDEFGGYPRARLLVIANEKNIPEAVGGILALSQVVVVSPESISMISEAASSRKYVFVFKSEKLSPKHERFLKHFAEKKYIYLERPGEISRKIMDIWRDKPQTYGLKDNSIASQAIGKVL